MGKKSAKVSDDSCPALKMLRGTMGRAADGTLNQPKHHHDPDTGICKFCHATESRVKP